MAATKGPRRPEVQGCGMGAFRLAERSRWMLIFWEVGEVVWRNGTATPDENGDLGRSASPAEKPSPTPQWPRIRRGLWSGSNFLGASLYLPWDLLGPSEAGAGPPALPQWTARTCQRCWAPGFGSGEGVPHPASPAYSWLPFPASERRRYPAGGAPRPPPCRSALLGAVPAGGLSCALGPDVSASRAVSLETLLHGDGLPGRHTPFLWAWAAAA